MTRLSIRCATGYAFRSPKGSSNAPVVRARICSGLAGPQFASFALRKK